MNRKGIGLILAFCFFATVAVSQPVKMQQLSKFDMQSTYIVKDDGRTISTAKYQPKNYWYPVTVPSTVLSGLVANNVYPSPYQGMNNMFIPDASDEFNETYDLGKYSFIPGTTNPWDKPYWYRTTFEVPAGDAGKLFQLIFKGINYRAAVWVNGRQIADSAQMAGMFADYELDVTSAVAPGKTNVLAVQIYPLDYPGLPDTPQLKAMGDFYLNGGPTGDIGKNVTMLCSVGWDWMPAVRDRNMGIWQPVYLKTSGKVVVRKPKIVTSLPRLPDTSAAEIAMQFELENLSDKERAGNVKITISPENFSGESVSFERNARVGANSTTLVDLNPATVKELAFKNPRLWWPNGHGDPHLYRAQIQFISNGEVLDDTAIVFGVRTVDSKLTYVGKYSRRDFYVNGKKVHLVGGAWVPDMMLNRDSSRYVQEMRLCRNSNMNLLRIWGGGITPPDVFWNLADRYGMLVWNDFWVTGDTQGEFKGSPDWPLQSRVFIHNMTRTIYRIRNHPSLLLWTGGNEGHAREELYYAMRDSVRLLDGTRPFIPSSSGFAKLPDGWKGSWPDGGPSGVYSSGPYSWQDPAEYHKKVALKTDWLFKDETGIPSQPPYASLGQIIPDLVPDTTVPYPLNHTWGYHDAATGNGRYDLYYKEALKRYGTFQSMKDFSDKMQLMNADGYRGIFEAPSSQLMETGGVMLWKINAAFPSVIWQVYDWYLRPNAGYYFMQRAIAPVHIQLNLLDSTVEIVNRSYLNEDKLSAHIQIFTTQGKKVLNENVQANVKGEEVKTIQSLAPHLKQTSEIHLVHLTLQKNDSLVSTNTYWMEKDHDYSALQQMPAAQVSVRPLSPGVPETLKANAIASRYSRNGMAEWTYELANTSDQFAFFLNPVLLDGDTQKEVLPSYWSDNYFSLAPGEKRIITVRCDEGMAPKRPLLSLEGWNVEKKVLEEDNFVFSKD